MKPSSEEKRLFEAAVLKRENELLKQVLTGLLKGISSLAEVATAALTKGTSDEHT